MFAGTAGRWAYGLLTSGDGDRRRGVRVSPPGCREPCRLLPTTHWSHISAWQARAQLHKTSFTHSRHPVSCLG